MKINNQTRDSLITAFRARLLDKLEVVPFVHQAAWWAASDGAILLDVTCEVGGSLVKLGDGTQERRALAPRPGGRARVIADLGAFKIGKSFGAALWAASFAAVPGARVQLVGIEYDLCAPEFEYLLEFLCSDRGMGMKAESLQNRPRDGKMWLDLPTGARFEARSWERKDSMKGKEVDAYVYCEAYQLPGLECYTSFSQNLRARDGYALFATTPDRPWVNEIHNAAHSGLYEFRDWHCTCGVHSSQNPLTFSQEAMNRDRTLMTREKFAIHYEGKLGDFVGRVYGYQRGERTFSQVSHPGLFDPASDGTSLLDIRLPDGWEVVGGADTGTNMSALLVAFSPEGEAFVLGEFPNYDYRAGSIERDEQVTIPGWARLVGAALGSLGSKAALWADQNSQFKVELRNYGIFLEANRTPLEARTEIAREYFQNGRVWLAPWLRILPFELENAAWPEEASASGKFARVKDRDHTLDCLEHVLSRRPSGKWLETKPRFGTWIEGFVGKKFADRRKADIHLGSQ